jgi:hypothetical protein
MVAVVPPRTWALPILFVLVVVPSIIAIVYSVVTREEAATVVLSVPVLLISAAALWLALPNPARLIVIRQDEPELDDLLFFLAPLEPGGPEEIPRDYLLQLHVAVCNVGGRKAVVSAIKLKGFFTVEGRPTTLPDAPPVVAGHQRVERSGLVIAERVMERRIEADTIPPPYVLEADDVVTLRFRMRRGIDWSPRWDLAALREFSQRLEAPLVRAWLQIVWRRGDKLVTEDFHVPIEVAQQDGYVRALKALTRDFTVRPDVPEQHISIE